MGDMREIFDAMKEAGKDRREARRERNTAVLAELSKEGFDVKWLTPYQFRINDVLDIYPTRGQWHDIKRNKRGHLPEVKGFVHNFFKPRKKVEG